MGVLHQALDSAGPLVPAVDLLVALHAVLQAQVVELSGRAGAYASRTPIHAAPLPAGHVHSGMTGVVVVNNRYKLTPEANAEYMREQVAKQQAGAGPEVNAAPGDSRPCHTWLVATCCSNKTTHMCAAEYPCLCQSSRPRGRSQPA